MNGVFTDEVLLHPELERLRKQNVELRALLAAVLSEYDGRKISVRQVNTYRANPEMLPTICWKNDAAHCDTVVWLAKEKGI